MKAPTTFRIGRNAASRPGYEATRVTPTTAGAAPAVAARLGETIEEAGSEAERTEDILSGRVDVARAQEADAKIADGFRTLMFSPEGYTKRAGREAVDKRQEIISALDNHRREILGTLTPRQRRLISKSDEARYQHTRSQVDGHYTKEIESYEMAESEARANTLMLDASNGYFARTAPVMPQEPGRETEHSSVGDTAVTAAGAAAGSPQEPTKGPPAAFVDNRNAMRTELKRLAAQKGLGPQATKSLLQNADDNLYGSIVTRLVGSNRSLEAASLLRGSPNIALSQATRARLERDIQEAGVNEQGFQVARLLSQSGRDLGEQLEALAQMHEKGLNLDVHDAAEKRVLAADKIQREVLDRAGEKAMADAQTWQSLNPTSKLPESERNKLRTTGKEAAFELWMLQGKQFVTTDQARLEEQTMDDRMLANRFGSHVQLAQSFAHRMSPDDFGKLTLRWRKGREELLNPDDAMTLERDVSQKNFLQDKLFYDKFKASPKDGMTADSISSRERRFEEAVVLRANQMAKESGSKKVGNSLYKLAMEEVWNNGAVVDDRYLPSVMMTKEEFERAKVEMSSGKSVGLEIGMPGQNVPSHAYLVTGEKVALTTKPGDDYVFTFDELFAKMKADRNGLDPTVPEVAAEFDRMGRARLQRTKDAKEIATVLNKTRAMALVQQLPAEFNREFNKRYEQAILGWHTAHDRPSIHAVGPKPTQDKVYRDTVAAVLESHAREFAAYGVLPADVLATLPNVSIPLNDPLRYVPRVAGRAAGFGQEFAGTGSGGRRGQKVDLSLTQAEQEFLVEMRQKWKRTEFTVPK